MAKSVVIHTYKDKVSRGIMMSTYTCHGLFAIYLAKTINVPRFYVEHYCFLNYFLKKLNTLKFCVSICFINGCNR